MRYAMVGLIGANLMCLIFNITTGNWGIIPINLLAIMCCTGAAILND